MFQFSFINLSGLEGICDGVMKKIFWHHPEITLFLSLANYMHCILWIEQSEQMIWRIVTYLVLCSQNLGRIMFYGSWTRIVKLWKVTKYYDMKKNEEKPSVLKHVHKNLLGWFWVSKISIFGYLRVYPNLTQTTRYFTNEESIWWWMHRCIRLLAYDMDQRIPDDVREIMEVSIDRCHSGLKLNKDSTICKCCWVKCTRRSLFLYGWAIQPFLICTFFEFST